MITSLNEKNIYYAWLLLVLLYFFSIICQQFNIRITTSNIAMSVFFVLIYCIALLLIIVRIAKKKVSICHSCYVIFSVFIIWSSVVSLLNYGKAYFPDGFTLTVFKLSFCFLALTVFSEFNISILDNCSNGTLRILLVAYIAYCILFIICIIKGYNRFVSTSINTVYYIVLLIPLVFLLRNNIIKILLLAIGLFSVIISNKRTAFLAAILALLIPYIIHMYSKNRKKISMGLIGLLLLGVGTYYFYEYISNIMNVDIIARFASIAEDGGSNRIIIYRSVWQAFNNSSLLGKVMGHGYNSVYYDSICGTSAHNDYLEVLYDYGIVGLFLYLSFLINIMKYIFRFRKYHKSSPDDDCFFLAMVSTFLLYLVISTTSHLILYPTYIVFAFAVFTIVIGKKEQISGV